MDLERTCFQQFPPRDEVVVIEEMTKPLPLLDDVVVLKRLIFFRISILR